jgi:hypothetical protein
MNHHSSRQLSSQEQTRDLETSLLDFFIFLKQSYKLVTLFSLLGIAVSIGYLLSAPKHYQASAQIQMAQVAAANNSLLVNNIEEPTSVILRLSSLTSYSDQSTQACGLDSVKDAQAILSKSVKLTIPKGITNVVDMKIISTSPEVSIACAQAVFDLIKTTQTQFTNSFIEEAKVKLLEAEERLAKIKEFLVKADKSGAAIGAAYLSTRDEHRYFVDKISGLRNAVSSNQGRATRLLAPIYVSDVPMARKDHVVLLAGLFGGLFFGLLIEFGRQLLTRLKVQLENNTVPK